MSAWFPRKGVSDPLTELAKKIPVWGLVETKANNQPVLFSMAVEEINLNVGRWLKITMITQV